MREILRLCLLLVLLGGMAACGSSSDDDDLLINNSGSPSENGGSDNGSGNPGNGGNTGGDGGNDGNSGSGGDSGNSGDDGNNNDGGGNDSQASRLNRYNVANRCVMFKSGEQYISKTPTGYAASADALDASLFYLKATDLGSYLLLSDYQRAEGEIGRKELLGISDPNGEYLDQAGNFIGEVGKLIAGLGDMSEFLTDIVLLPAYGQAGLGDEQTPRARALGEAIAGAGDTLAAQTISPELGLVTKASDLAVWELAGAENDEGPFTLASQVTGQYLAVADGKLGLSPAVADNSQFEIIPAQGCAAYPEVTVNASVSDAGPAIYLREVERFKNVEGLDGDDIFGFVDTHAHISAYEFIGGRINYGDPFHKFGIDHALGDCEENHGPQGMTGLVEMVTSSSSGPGQPHDTQGWPSYNYWPVNNSLQHHQSYYKWIERAFLAGQKIMVNHLVHNEVLCQLNPYKQNDCDAMPAIELQAHAMQDMQDYIDAQSGGPGEGWFRIVTTPAEARQVIGDGKMAVILGVEMSKVLNCGEFQGVPQCTEQQILDRLDRLEALKVRSLFPVHKFDNAFGGHLPDLGNPQGIAGILYAGNLAETGHPIEYEHCPAEEYSGHEEGGTGPHGGANYVELPSESTFSQEGILEYGIIEQLLFHIDYLGKVFPSTPEEFAEFDPRRGTGDHCNVRGLTSLGEFLVRELMRRQWFIETDHISRKAAAKILEITGERGYPIVNSHGGWGGTEALRNRIAAQGGSSSSFAGGNRNGWVDTLVRDGGRPRASEYMVGPFGGTGFATDVNGIASLPGQPGAEDPELYPFQSVDRRVTFDVQKTGDRSFGLFDGRGVAHYGLYADKIADMEKNSERSPEQVDQALGELFTSAEAYIRMWERMLEAGGE